MKRFRAMRFPPLSKGNTPTTVTPPTFLHTPPLPTKNTLHLPRLSHSIHRRSAHATTPPNHPSPPRMEIQKFRTVSTTPFAQRHRTPKPSHPVYTLSPDTLRIALHRNKHPAFLANLLPTKQHNPTDPPLTLVILPYPNNVFRVLFEDTTPPTIPRHTATADQVLHPHAAPTASRSGMRINRQGDDASAILTLDNSPFAIALTFHPFRLDLATKQHTTKAPLLSLNPQSRLKFHTFQPAPPDQSTTTPRGEESVALDIAFPFATNLTGIPERTAKYNLTDTIDQSTGQVLAEPYRLYNLDVSYYQLDDNMGLYGTVPLLVGRTADNAAGMLWLNASETFVDVSSMSPPTQTGRHSHWYSESGFVDLCLLPGPSCGDVFRQYLSLTGAPAMPPRFSLGYHQCRYSYMSQEDALAVDKGFDQHQIPYDVLWLDIDHTDDKRYFTWNSETFPDPSALQNQVAEHGRKVVTIIDPHIKVDPKFPLHRLAEKEQLYIKNPDGTSYFGKCWAGVSGYLDYTSERVRAAWASRFNPKDYPHFSPHLHVWNDMNEPSVFDGPEGSIPKHMLHEGGVEHRHVHNLYGHSMIRATYEGLRAARENKQRPFVLTRSFFAGTHRYGFVWTGDNSGRWDHLAATVPMLLALQTTGIVASGADVGGFFYDPKPDLLVRWYQLGAFQPFFRGHSFEGTKRREPWLFGEPYTSLIKDAIKVRYSLLPYWYTLFAGTTLGSAAGFPTRAVAPPMRPLSWEFPKENDVDTRWLVGNSLMVSPVVEEGCTEHTIPLPQGSLWYDLYNPICPGKKLPEEDEVTLASPLERMFVLQRGGTIVPRLDTARRSSAYMKNDPYTLVVALDENAAASGELYVDDGDSYEYETGAFVLRQFVFGDGVLSASTIAGSGGFDGLDTKLSKLCILGFGTVAPKSIQCGGQSIPFTHDSEAESLTIDGLDAEALTGEWRVSIDSAN